MKMILGLGNPGKKYKENRHNVGFMVIDRLAETFSAKFRRSMRMRAVLAQVRIDEQQVVLAKPLTYMNSSGEAARRIVDFYNISSDDIITVYDDIDLALGDLRLRRGGSAAGHRGMSSLIQELKTQDINRIRIGICRPSREPVSDYVLSDFSAGDKPLIDETINTAAKAGIDWVSKGIEAVMSVYNIRRNK